MTTPSTLWTAARDDLRGRRERRAAVRRLREDLASYRTPAEVEDLLATIEAQEAAGEAVREAAVIRGILLDNLRRHYDAQQAPLRQAVGL